MAKAKIKEIKNEEGDVIAVTEMRTVHLPDGSTEELAQAEAIIAVNSGRATFDAPEKKAAGKKSTENASATKK